MKLRLVSCGIQAYDQVFEVDKILAGDFMLKKDGKRRLEIDGTRRFKLAVVGDWFNGYLKGKGSPYDHVKIQIMEL
jgi:hypothetical protein